MLSFFFLLSSFFFLLSSLYHVALPPPLPSHPSAALASPRFSHVALPPPFLPLYRPSRSSTTCIAPSQPAQPLRDPHHPRRPRRPLPPTPPNPPDRSGSTSTLGSRRNETLPDFSARRKKKLRERGQYLNGKRHAGSGRSLLKTAIPQTAFLRATRGRAQYYRIAARLVRPKSSGTESPIIGSSGRRQQPADVFAKVPPNSRVLALRGWTQTYLVVQASIRWGRGAGALTQTLGKKPRNLGGAGTQSQIQAADVRSSRSPNRRKNKDALGPQVRAL